MRMRGFVGWMLVALMGASVLSSCNKKDTLVPEIDVDSPKPQAVLLAGHPVSFDADFDDDQGLRSYQIIISITSPAQNLGDNPGTPFTFDRTWELPNRREVDDIRHQEIVIPRDATPGSYSFRVFCTDQAGNQTYEAIPVTISR